MRALKFRSWNRILGRMSEPFDLHEIPKNIHWHCLDLMQFTGLIDNTGAEICEGDICEEIILGDRASFIKNNGSINAALVSISFENGGWGYMPIFPELAHPDDKSWRAFWNSEDGEMINMKYFTVVGNIYRNPEILKAT